MTDNSFCSPMDRAVGEKNCPTDVPQESPDFVDEIPSGDDTAAEEKVELVIFTMKDRFFCLPGKGGPGNFAPWTYNGPARLSRFPAGYHQCAGQY